MTRGSVAKKVREQKEAHPERYCSVKGCLWNTTRGPCKTHGPQRCALHVQPGPDAVELGKLDRLIQLAEEFCTIVRDMEHPAQEAAVSYIRDRFGLSIRRKVKHD